MHFDISLEEVETEDRGNLHGTCHWEIFLFFGFRMRIAW